MIGMPENFTHSCINVAGGIGGFVLAVFHKIESSNFKWKWYKKSKTARNPVIAHLSLDF